MARKRPAARGSKGFGLTRWIIKASCKGCLRRSWVSKAAEPQDAKASRSQGAESQDAKATSSQAARLRKKTKGPDLERMKRRRERRRTRKKAKSNSRISCFSLCMEVEIQLTKND